MSDNTSSSMSRPTPTGLMRRSTTGRCWIFTRSSSSGSYDVALITKDAEGKVHVEKHEKPTQHGVWAGVLVGALVGVLFPPAVVGVATVGGAAAVGGASAGWAATSSRACRGATPRSSVTC